MTISFSFSGAVFKVMLLFECLFGFRRRVLAVVYCSHGVSSGDLIYKFMIGYMYFKIPGRMFMCPKMKDERK